MAFIPLCPALKTGKKSIENSILGHQPGFIGRGRVDAILEFAVPGTGCGYFNTTEAGIQLIVSTRKLPVFFSAAGGIGSPLPSFRRRSHQRLVIIPTGTDSGQWHETEKRL